MTATSTAWQAWRETRATPDWWYNSDWWLEDSDIKQGLTRMSDAILRPGGEEDLDGWKAYWATQEMSWRTEPEIPEIRQCYLAQRQEVPTDVFHGVYAFRDERGPIALTRADVEWLIVHGVRSHDTGLRRINKDGTVQDSGLDLRGADLRSVNLRELPLARLVGGLAPDLVAAFAVEYQESIQQLAAIMLDGADLGSAHLEESILTSAQLNRARLIDTHLEQAFLYKAHLDGCNMTLAHCEGAFLTGAHLIGVLARNIHLEGADLTSATLSDAFLADAHCQGANLRHARLERVTLQDAILSGSDLSFAHLEGAQLINADLGASPPHPPNTQHHPSKPIVDGTIPVLNAANLYGCFFNSITDLSAVRLGEETTGFVKLADAHYDGVNLGVVDWQAVTVLGDEREAKLAAMKGSAEQPLIQLARFQMAIRANRQLAVALRAQGMNEEADHFAYRAQILRSQSMWLRLRGNRKGLPRLRLCDKLRLAGGYLFSLFLNALAGYGYSPGLAVYWYLFSIGLFSSLYYSIGAVHGPHLTITESLVFSVTSFHGRGFFPGGIRLDDPMVVVAAVEAIWGLLIELSFIATFTQRFFAR